MTEQPLFYIILIGLLIIVFAQILHKKSKQIPKNNNQALEEFEQTVELFASDLEEQNEALVQLFTDTKRDYELHLAKQSGKIESLEKQSLDMSQELTQLKMTLNELHTAASAKEAEIKYYTNKQLHSEVAIERAEGSQVYALPTQEVSEIMVAQEEVAQEETLLPTLKNRYPELFDLYDNGKSIEYIAKKLGKNKGEISLILMLSKQEEGI